MKKKLTKRMLLGVLAAAMFGVSANDAEAQTFTNTGGGTYNATCNAVIRLKSATAGAVQADISGNSIGTDADNAIPGIVEWAAASGNQVVLAKHYQRMILTGASTKDVNNGVVMVGAACSLPLLAGYDLLGTYPYAVVTTGTNRSGNVIYTSGGTFTYGGATNQNIFPTITGVAGTTTDVGAYRTIALNGGTAADNLTATVVAGDSVAVAVLTSAETHNISVAGALVINQGGTGSNSDINGDLAIESTGKFELAATTTMNIAGAFTNASTDGTNLTFACNSTVEYDGTANPQLIMPTLDADNRRYGNLVLSGGNKQGGTSAGYPDSISVCNNFSLADGNLDMFTNGGSLIMNAPQTGTDLVANTGVAHYDGLAEVEGSMIRRTDDQLRTYTFNNSATEISLETVAANPTSMTMNVRPGQNPDSYVGTTDVKRDINLAYAGNSGNFNMTVKAGYLQSEAKDKTGTGEDWPATYTEEQIRFYEAKDAESEKVGTGKVYAKVTSTGTTFGSVTLPGIGSITDSPTTPVALPNGIGVFASGNDLVLRGGPTTFYSVQDGRWSNPNTWDEGTTPTSIDNVELRTTVYAGIVNLFSTGNDIPENGLPNTTDGMATTITVASKTGLPAANNPAFLLGNEDNGGTFVFKTTAVGVGGSPLTIINNNTTVPTGLAAFEVTAPTARTGIADKGSYTTNPGFSGIWVTPWTNVAGTNPVVLQTNQIENKGTVNNEGIIEIGQ